MLQDLRDLCQVLLYTLGYDFEGASWFLKQLLQVKMVLKVILKSLSKASPIIASMNGYLSHELHRCIEVKVNILVRWKSLEAHTIGFRKSPQYQEWKKLLHDFMTIPRG